MSLQKHYCTMWESSLQKFKRGEFEFDAQLKAKRDTRYGVSLLARPSEQLKQSISGTLEKLKAVAPNQYYYPDTDLHITILSIISCCAGFTLDEIEPAAYRRLVRSALTSITPFRIRFRGVTASPSCILIQGFPEDQRLETLRSNLRRRFKHSNLRHSMDQRYQLETAHMTVIRFKKPFAEAERFVNTISGLRDQDFGSCLVDGVELVGNDWYQKKSKVQLIGRFALNNI